MKTRRFFCTVLFLIIVFDLFLMADKKFKVAGGQVVSKVESIFSNFSEPEENASVLKKNSRNASFSEPDDLSVFRRCYGDITFTAGWNEEKRDWLIHIKSPITPESKTNFREGDFWWAEGRLLPESELSKKDSFWPLIYEYKKLKDPSTLTAEEVARIREFSSSENRQSAGGTPMYFYDFIYAAKSQAIIEDHISHITFLGKKTKVHERIEAPVKKVEEKIIALMRKENSASGEVTSFVNGLKSADAYNWRIIQGTGRKSFHTYGIAIDLLPKKLNGKAIFWGWTKDKDPKNWMLTPVSKRWNPPESVIEAFASEGFIWGGNWVIFDNMHFEYHPELLFRN